MNSKLRFINSKHYLYIEIYDLQNKLNYLRFVLSGELGIQANKLVNFDTIYKSCLVSIYFLVSSTKSIIISLKISISYQR